MKRLHDILFKVNVEFGLEGAMYQRHRRNDILLHRFLILLSIRKRLTASSQLAMQVFQVLTIAFVDVFMRGLTIYS
jgi:hypothetical protein